MRGSPLVAWQDPGRTQLKRAARWHDWAPRWLPSRVTLGLRRLALKRYTIPVLCQLPTGQQLLKVSPLAAWTNAEVWGYLKRRGIPVLPLYDNGYSSIGCAPCTTPPADPDNLRSGRWGGRKLECGIHIASD